MMHRELQSESNSTVWVHRQPTIAVYDYGFQTLSSVNPGYWLVKFFMDLYVKTALLYFIRFTIGSQLDSLNISACNVILFVLHVFGV